MKTPEIKFINFGIASRQGNTIYFNKKLKKIPLLYNKILLHELDHSEGFKLKDLLIDLKNQHLKGAKLEYYKFILKNPSSWVEFCPVWVYDGKLVINPTILLLWGFLLSVGGIIGWLLI